MVSGLPRGRQLYAEYAGGFVFRNFAGNAERFAGEGTIFLHELFGFVKDLLDSVWLDHERFDFSVVYFLLSSISASCATFEHQKKLRPQHRILRLPRDVATVKGGSSICVQHKVACAAQENGDFSGFETEKRTAVASIRVLGGSRISGLDQRVILSRCVLRYDRMLPSQTFMPVLTQANTCSLVNSM